MMGFITITVNIGTLYAIDRLMTSLCKNVEIPVDIHKRLLVSISQDIEAVVHRKTRTASILQNTKKPHKLKLKYHEAAVLEVLLRASSDTEIDDYNKFSFRAVADQLNQKIV